MQWQVQKVRYSLKNRNNCRGGATKIMMPDESIPDKPKILFPIGNTMADAIVRRDYGQRI